MSKLNDLLTRVGLAKRTPDDPPTPLDEKMVALRLSLESIEKSGLEGEERETFITETLEQFRDDVLKAKPNPFADEEDDEEDTSSEEDDAEKKKKTNKRDDSQEDDMTPDQIKKYDEVIAKLETENKTLSETNTTLAERVTKMEADNAARVRLAKAETLVAGTGIKAEEVAEVIAKVGEDNPTLPAILDALRKAQSDAHLFEELGAIGSGSPTDAVKARAVEIQKSEPKLTAEQAIVKAYRENPAAYAEARAAEDEALLARRR
jgi:hypothetical protein